MAQPQEEEPKKKIFDEGEPTEEQFQNGPVEDRSCTDIICCLLFVCFIGGMVYITIESFDRGDPVKLLAPFASDNTQCGFDSRSDQKYLFVPNFLASPTNMFVTTACVASCPLIGDALFTTYGISTAFQYNSEPYFERYCLPGDEEAVKTFLKNAGGEKIGQYISDLYTAWKVLLIAVGLSFVLALVYMIVLRCCAKIMVWITFIGFVVLLAVLGYFFYDKSENALDEGDQLNYKILAIMFWVLDGIIFLVICCLYDDIQLALTIIEASGQFVFQSFSVLLVPIVIIVVACGFMAYWIVTVVYLYSIGDIKQYGNTPFASVEWDDNTRNLWYYHLFALFWILAFFLAILQFLIAGTAAQWYFSSGSDQSGSGSVCKSLYWIFRYHLGSLAFGSLILAIIMFIRFIFEYMRKKVEEGGPANRLTKCLLACASCCLSCIGKCILFLTKNAYIQVAIRSVCFCSAAYKAFQLMLRNVVRFALVNGFAYIFTFFGKVLVGLGTAFICWLIMTNWSEVKNELYSYIIPTIACFIIGYIFGTIFLSVYDLACATILQCFLIDEETAHMKGLTAGKHRPAVLETFFSGIRKNPDAPGKSQQLP